MGHIVLISDRGWSSSGSAVGRPVATAQARSTEKICQKAAILSAYSTWSVGGLRGTEALSGTGTSFWVPAREKWSEGIWCRPRPTANRAAMEEW